MVHGLNNTNLYILTELYQTKLKVASGANWVQVCFPGNRNVPPDDAMSPANMKPRADNSPSQLFGLRQELEFSKEKNFALLEQLRSVEVHITVGRNNRGFRIQKHEFDVRAQHDNLRRLTQETDKRRILVKSARVKETRQKQPRNWFVKSNKKAFYNNFSRCMRYCSSTKKLT